MHGSVYTVDKPLSAVDEYHYYKTCPRLQDATRRPREHDEDEPSGLEECEDCQERREHNRRQRIGLSGPARNLVEADPEDYPLKTDGGTKNEPESNNDEQNKPPFGGGPGTLIGTTLLQLCLLLGILAAVLEADDWTSFFLISGILVMTAGVLTDIAMYALYLGVLRLVNWADMRWVA